MSFLDENDGTIPKNVLYGSEITVLGIGNIILSDEGFGVRVLEYLEAHYDFPEEVQCIDGGTLGIELTQYLTGTKKLLVLDSIKSGKEKGTIFRIANDAVMQHFQDKLSAHEVGIQDVLALLAVTGREIPEVVVLGAEPYALEAGVGLSEGMKKLLPQVAFAAVEELARWGIILKEKEEAGSLDLTGVEQALGRTQSLLQAE